MPMVSPYSGGVPPPPGKKQKVDEEVKRISQGGSTGGDGGQSSAPVIPVETQVETKTQTIKDILSQRYRTQRERTDAFKQYFREARTRYIMKKAQTDIGEPTPPTPEEIQTHLTYINKQDVSLSPGQKLTIVWYTKGGTKHTEDVLAENFNQRQMEISSSTFQGVITKVDVAGGETIFQQPTSEEYQQAYKIEYKKYLFGEVAPYLVKTGFIPPEIDTELEKNIERTAPEIKAVGESQYYKQLALKAEFGIISKEQFSEQMGERLSKNISYMERFATYPVVVSDMKYKKFGVIPIGVEDVVPYRESNITFSELKEKEPALYLTPDISGALKPTLDIRRWQKESFINLTKQDFGGVKAVALLSSQAIVNVPEWLNINVFDIKSSFIFKEDKSMYLYQKQYSTTQKMRKGEVLQAWGEAQIPMYTNVILPVALQAYVFKPFINPLIKKGVGYTVGKVGAFGERVMTQLETKLPSAFSPVILESGQKIFSSRMVNIFYRGTQKFLQTETMANFQNWAIRGYMPGKTLVEVPTKPGVTYEFTEAGTNITRTLNQYKWVVDKSVPFWDRRIWLSPREIAIFNQRISGSGIWRIGFPVSRETGVGVGTTTMASEMEIFKRGGLHGLAPTYSFTQLATKEFGVNIPTVLASEYAIGGVGGFVRGEGVVQPTVEAGIVGISNYDKFISNIRTGYISKKETLLDVVTSGIPKSEVKSYMEQIGFKFFDTISPKTKKLLKVQKGEILTGFITPEIPSDVAKELAKKGFYPKSIYIDEIVPKTVEEAIWMANQRVKEGLYKTIWSSDKFSKANWRGYAPEDTFNMPMRHEVEWHEESHFFNEPPYSKNKKMIREAHNRWIAAETYYATPYSLRYRMSMTLPEPEWIGIIKDVKTTNLGIGAGKGEYGTSYGIIDEKGMWSHDKSWRAIFNRFKMSGEAQQTLAPQVTKENIVSLLKRPSPIKKGISPYYQKFKVPSETTLEYIPLIATIGASRTLFKTSTETKILQPKSEIPTVSVKQPIVMENIQERMYEQMLSEMQLQQKTQIPQQRILFKQTQIQTQLEEQVYAQMNIQTEKISMKTPTVNVSIVPYIPGFDMKMIGSGGDYGFEWGLWGKRKRYRESTRFNPFEGMGNELKNINRELIGFEF